jgi:hypothetical protein
MIELMGNLMYLPVVHQRLTIFKDFQLKTYFSFDYLSKEENTYQIKKSCILLISRNRMPMKWMQHGRRWISKTIEKRIAQNHSLLMRKFRVIENCKREFSFSHLPRKILSRTVWEVYLSNFDYGKTWKNRSWIMNHQKQIVGVTCETCVKTGKGFGSIQLELKTRNENWIWLFKIHG